jgi:SAM-dependent methyltransferase
MRFPAGRRTSWAAPATRCLTPYAQWRHAAAVLDWWQASGHGPGFAVDLGCGDGADTAELLCRGWTVLAVDRQLAAIALAEHNVPDHDRPRLRTLAADFTALALPAADLIYCGWSLPHCPATRFPGTWHAIRAALRPRGPHRRAPARPPR